VFWDGKVAHGCKTGRRAVAGLRYWALHQSFLLTVIIVIVTAIVVIVIVVGHHWQVFLDDIVDKGVVQQGRNWQGERGPSGPRGGVERTGKGSERVSRGRGRYANPEKG